MIKRKDWLYIELPAGMILFEVINIVQVNRDRANLICKRLWPNGDTTSIGDSQVFEYRNILDGVEEKLIKLYRSKAEKSLFKVLFIV